MIDLRSSATAENVSHLSCDSPSPGGSNEQSECRFVCCSGVGRDEGELSNRGPRSALTCLSALNSKLTTHHSKLPKIPLIKVHSHLITVNHTQSNIFRPP